MPKGATRILRSEHCENQGFAKDGILALQCHVEMTAEMVPEWAALYSSELETPTPTVQSADEMRRDLQQRIGALQRVADELYREWLRNL